MRKINKSVLKNTWFKFDKDESVEIQIRPFPVTTLLIGIVNKDDYQKTMWERYNYCVVDWKGILNEKGEPLECSEENKKFVFDWDEELLIFIGNKITKLSETIKPIEKKT